jgi:hypothetical protein
MDYMPENNQKLNLNWSAVEKALAEGTFSGYKIGVMETEKLFRSFLEEKKIPGRDVNAKIKYAANFLSRNEQLKYAREMHKKIAEQPHFEIAHEETKQIIQGYWQAMLDLHEALATLTIWQKMNLRFRYFLAQIIRKIKIITAVSAALILLILFFYETAIGKNAALTLGKSVHFLVFAIGPWILGATTAAFLLWLGLKVLGKRKREF